MLPWDFFLEVSLCLLEKTFKQFSTHVWVIRVSFKLGCRARWKCNACFNDQGCLRLVANIPCQHTLLYFDVQARINGNVCLEKYFLLISLGYSYDIILTVPFLSNRPGEYGVWIFFLNGGDWGWGEVCSVFTIQMICWAIRFTVYSQYSISASWAAWQIVQRIKTVKLAIIPGNLFFLHVIWHALGSVKLSYPTHNSKALE